MSVFTWWGYEGERWDALGRFCVLSEMPGKEITYPVNKWGGEETLKRNLILCIVLPEAALIQLRFLRH